MTQLIQAKLGMTAVILGIVGAAFGVGGVENSVTTLELLQSIGVALTSLMLMYVGVELVKAAE